MKYLMHLLSVRGLALALSVGSTVTTAQAQFPIVYDSPRSDIGWSTKVDSHGDLVVTGMRNDNRGPGNPAYTALVTKYDHAGQLLWRRTFRGLNPTDHMAVPVVTRIDANDDIVVAGYTYTRGNAPLGGCFTLKYSPDGTLLWKNAERDKTSNQFYAWKIAFDPSQNVFVYAIAHTGVDYPVLVKYSASGERLWIKRFSDHPVVQLGSQEDIVSDTSGNVYMMTSPVVNDRVVCSVKKLNPDGTPAWNKFVDDPQQTYARQIQIDASDNIYICATKGTGYEVVPGVIVEKIDADGKKVWKRTAASTLLASDYSASAITSEGDLIVAGFSPSKSSKTGYDLCIMRWSSSGDLVWKRLYSDAVYYMVGIEVDGEGSAYVGYTGMRASGITELRSAKLSAEGVRLRTDFYHQSDTSEELFDGIAVDRNLHVAYVICDSSAGESGAFVTVKF